MSSLECFDSILNPDLIIELRKRNIKTVTDFMQESIQNICSITKLPFAVVIEMRNKLLNSFRSEPCSGLKLLTDVHANSTTFSTGIKEMDNLIGMIEPGIIYEFCGLSGSGKTQLCLAIAASCSIQGKRAYFIDTKNDYSSHRIVEMLEKKITNRKDILKCLERIEIIRVHTLYKLIDVLHELKNILPSRSAPLIVIDCISTLYFLSIGSKKPIGLGLLNHIASVLKFLAVECHLAIFVTNLATKYQNTPENKVSTCYSIKPCIGKFWQDVCNIRIITKKESISHVRLLIDKHDFSRPTSDCNIDLNAL